VPGGDDGSDVGRAPEPERRAETSAAEQERSDEQEHPDSCHRDEDRVSRAHARERVGGDAAVRHDRARGGRYAGRARCLNAFTSSSGAASGMPSRQVTTGTPTCS